MSNTILLTSFTTWLPHHTSNSSDDLLAEIEQLEKFTGYLTFLRQLPVDISPASTQVLAKLEQLQPQVIICCGMAEKRKQLTLESCATCQDNLIQTSVDLEQLVVSLVDTEISHDAGKFVCEGLYYQVLKHIRDHQLTTFCLFVHVPVLTPTNKVRIKADFCSLIEQFIYSATNPPSKSSRLSSDLICQ